MEWLSSFIYLPLFLPSFPFPSSLLMTYAFIAMWFFSFLWYFIRIGKQIHFTQFCKEIWEHEGFEAHRLPYEFFFHYTFLIGDSSLSLRKCIGWIECRWLTTLFIEFQEHLWSFQISRDVQKGPRNIAVERQCACRAATAALPFKYRPDCDIHECRRGMAWGSARNWMEGEGRSQTTGEEGSLQSAYC